MKNAIITILLCLGVIIGTALMVALGVGLAGLIWWGVGSLVVWAFGINFVWTFWHGVVIAVLMFMLKGAFQITVKKEN